MCRLILKSIGAIKDIDMKVKRYTFLLGAQSSGKSTIAKLLCHCQWVEKRCYTNFEEESARFMEGNTFIDGLTEYHRLYGYIKEDSYILYEGDYARIEYRDARLSIVLSHEADLYEYPKICYIPAERNLIAAIPNLQKYNDTNDLILYFMYDWFDARDYIKNVNLGEILDRAIRYEYVKSADKNNIYDGDADPLELENASSGVQSILPLFTVVSYILKSVYERYKPLSAEQKMQVENYRTEVTNMTAMLTALQEELKRRTSTNEENLKDRVEKVMNDPRLKSIMDSEPIMRDMIESAKREFFYEHSELYIEEPEQNLFPDAQQNFVYWLMSHMKEGQHAHSVFITTHSPFVLFSLNNCLMGGLVGEKLGPDDVKRCPSREAWTAPEEVAVYEIHDGRLLCIQDGSGLLMNNFLNRAYRRINTEFLTMLDYYGN